MPTAVKPAERLSQFGIHDLRKIARATGCPQARGSLSRDQLIRALADESPSALGYAMEAIIASGSVNQADPEVERALGLLDAACAKESSTQMGRDAGEAMELVSGIKAQLDVTQEGVRRFAEDVDARLDKVEALARRAAEHEPLRIVVERAPAKSRAGSKPEILAEGFAHREFPNLLAMAQAEVNILMVGPAGSGKTTAAEMLSKALGVDFYFNGAIDTEYKLKGFIDAQGRLVQTSFRQAFEHGGVYLFDEVDASLPAATMAFNAALANGWCDFPDKRVGKHPSTVIIAAANTYMGGATFEYVGRNKQDAAFADRFSVLEWDVDEALETALCRDKAWCEHVQRVRARAKAKGLKVIISPRASFDGAKLLGKGLPWDFAERSCIRKGMTLEQWNQVK